MNQWKIYKSIRKPIPPQGKIERPKKGPYKRPHNKKDIYGEEE